MAIKTAVRAVKEHWLIAAIIGLGLGLRLWSIDFGLPYTYAPDEAWHMSVPLRILQTGDLNPHWLGYPHLVFYLNAIAFSVYFLAGKALGIFGSISDLVYAESLAVGVGHLAVPSEFLLLRGLTALAGSCSILVVYLIGRRRSAAAGCIAALLFAVSPANVYNSHLIRLDTFAMLFVLLAFLWIDRAFVKPNLRAYILAGIGVGLAFSGKYNAVLIAAALVVGHWLNYGWRGLLRPELYIAGLASLITFAVTNPFSVMDLPGFFQGLGMAQSAQTTHTGMEGDTITWYASFLWGSEGWLVLLACLGIVRAIIRRSKRDLVLISFPLVYYLVINFFNVRNDRTVMLVVPFLDLLAAFLLVDLALWLKALSPLRASNSRPRPTTFTLSTRLGVAFPRLSRTRPELVLVVGTFLLAWHPLMNSVNADVALAKTDSRETARVWIERNLPPGSRIALESYSPYVDPKHFVVEGFDGIIDHTPDWYIRNGFEYLVLSYGAYGRYYESATHYPEFIERYNSFFDQFTELKRFNDGGSEIRILQTNTTALPSHRTSERWGVFGPWLELVGYDWRDPTLTMYWRVLDTRRELFLLTTHLLDQNDREIARFAANPFTQGALQSTRIIQVPWTIVPPPSSRPGVYRLQLDLDAEGLGRVSTISLSYQPISDKAFIGPLKFTSDPPSSAELNAAQPAGAAFGNAILLSRYALDSRTHRSEESLSLTLYWQSKTRVDKDYTVFVHLLDASGNMRAQMDAMPYGGRYPTSFWDAGEIVRDMHMVFLPKDLIPGEYSLEIGLYEYPSLERLIVSDASGQPLGDHFVMRGVTIR